MRRIAVTLLALLGAVIVGGCRPPVSEPEPQEVLAPHEERALSALTGAVEEQRAMVSGVERRLAELKGKSAPDLEVQRTADELAHTQKILRALEERLGQEREAMLKTP